MPLRAGPHAPPRLLLLSPSWLAVDGGRQGEVDDDEAWVLRHHALHRGLQNEDRGLEERGDIRAGRAGRRRVNHPLHILLSPPQKRFAWRSAGPTSSTGTPDTPTLPTATASDAPVKETGTNVRPARSTASAVAWPIWGDDAVGGWMVCPPPALSMAPGRQRSGAPSHGWGGLRHRPRQHRKAVCVRNRSRRLAITPTYPHPRRTRVNPRKTPPQLNPLRLPPPSLLLALPVQAFTMMGGLMGAAAMARAATERWAGARACAARRAPHRPLRAPPTALIAKRGRLEAGGLGGSGPNQRAVQSAGRGCCGRARRCAPALRHTAPHPPRPRRPHRHAGRRRIRRRRPPGGRRRGPGNAAARARRRVH